MTTFSGIQPDLSCSNAIEKGTHAHVNMCWNCSSCDGECPVNISSNRLRPQKAVHLASLGLMDELAALPEIWFCLSCGRCIDVCPNRVRPMDVIAYARDTAIRQKRISAGALAAYKKLMRQFQHVRWHIASTCMAGGEITASEAQYDEWLATPIHRPEARSLSNPGDRGSLGARRYIPKNTASSCFTCSECTNACPVFSDRSIFDPQRIIRMINLGVAAQQIRSPSIWLCIGCRQCTYSCSQLVAGHEIIEGLRKMAISEKIVPADFAYRYAQAQQVVYPILIEKIDRIFTPFFCTRH